MSRKLYHCPFWLESLEADQEDDESSLNADEVRECQVGLKECFECESCNYSTENKHDLISHLSKTHQNRNHQDSSYNESKNESERIKCSKCSYHTVHTEMLQWHLQLCHGEKPVLKIEWRTAKTWIPKPSRFQCLLCSANYSDTASMSHHLYHDHNIAYPFKCDICRRTFPQESYLSLHKFTHYNAVGWTCQLCKTTFKNKIYLTEHLTTVHQRQVCEICISPFETVRMLQKHLLNKHSRYFCCACKQIFRGKKPMKLHHCTERRSHSGLRNSEKNDSKDEAKQRRRRVYCKYCKSALLYSHADLKMHMEDKHPEKLLPCTQCHRIFVSSIFLQIHVRNMHSGRVLYCEHCPYSTGYSTTMVVHWRRFHMLPDCKEQPKFRIKKPEPVFIQITHKTPTVRTYGNRKLLKKVNEDSK